MQGFDGPDAITAGVGMGRNVLCGGAMGILASWHLGMLDYWIKPIKEERNAT